MWLHLIRPRPPNARKEFFRHPVCFTGFIGISPLRLHYGRAANYGSIIIPCACHRHHRKQSGFRCISSVARSHKEGLGAPTSRLWVSPTQVKYLMTVYSIFNVQRRTLLSSHFLTATNNAENETKTLKKIKKFFSLHGTKKRQ